MAMVVVLMEEVVLPALAQTEEALLEVELEPEEREAAQAAERPHVSANPEPDSMFRGSAADARTGEGRDNSDVGLVYVMEGLISGLN